MGDNKEKKNYYFKRTVRNHFWLGSLDGQQKIADLKVAVAGLGGMGSGIALALGRLGVKHFNLADDDIIEVSNINRQVIANKGTLQRSKADVTSEMLWQIDPDITIKIFKQGVCPETMEAFLSNVDVVVDEVDVYPIEMHVELHRQAMKLKLPIYSSYVIGMGTHLYKFHSQDFTIEDFYHPECFHQKTRVAGIIKSYLRPVPSYMDTNIMQQFMKELDQGNVPIFGPSCLLGHGMVAMRLVLDMLEIAPVQTPIMPAYLMLDLASLQFQQLCFERW